MINRVVEHASAPPPARPHMLTTEVSVSAPAGPKPAMIWRKTAEGSPNVGPSPNVSGVNAPPVLPPPVGHATGGEQLVARQAAGAAPPGPAEGGPTADSGGSAPSTSAASQPGPVDLVSIVELVRRTISKRLAVERERRGMK
jgi:hypothetical protein